MIGETFSIVVAAIFFTMAAAAATVLIYGLIAMIRPATNREEDCGKRK